MGEFIFHLCGGRSDLECALGKDVFLSFFFFPFSVLLSGVSVYIDFYEEPSPSVLGYGSPYGKFKRRDRCGGTGFQL